MNDILETIKQMKTYELIRVMVKSLERPWTDVVAMGTFGESVGEICYGCAATNTLCELAQKKFSTDNISYSETRATSLGIHWTSRRKLSMFEEAISDLSQGYLTRYNEAIGYLYNSGEIPHLIIPSPLLRKVLDDFGIPATLLDEYTQEDLDTHLALADYLELWWDTFPHPNKEIH